MEKEHTAAQHLSTRAGFWRNLWSLGCGDGTETDRKNTAQINKISMAWAGSILLAAWLIAEFQLPNPVKWSLVLVPNVIVLFAVRAYLKMLRMADELIRRIHLEGLAVAFGTTYLLAIGYVLAEAAGAPELDSVFLVLVMTVAWIFGNVRALRRYR